MHKKPTTSKTASLSLANLPSDINSNSDIKTNKIGPENKEKQALSPTQKERWAYAIEFSAKIIYPLSFFIYNIVYWTSYYGM